jgi:hypothetical protein
MNYNIDLPEELKTASMPKMKIAEQKLIILNRPYLMDWLFPAFIILIFSIMIINGKLSLINDDDSDYVTLILILFIFLIVRSFSLNRVRIDFEKKLISIKNYNPLVNLWRKLFQMPFAIGFKEVNKIFTDNNSFSRQLIRFYVILETDAPYQFRIAIFAEKNQSIIFTDYLTKLIKHHSIHADAVSDLRVKPEGRPTVMP